MPMLMTVRMRLPVAPVHVAVAHLVGEVAHPAEHLVDVGHDVVTVDLDDLVGRRPQRDVQHRRGPR